MSNEPIFEKLAREYATRGKSYENISAPYQSSGTKQPVTHTPVYGPNPHLDGPFREPLPKRTLAHLIELPKPDSEFVKHVQELISKAPQMALQGTLMGSVASSFKGASMGPEIVDEAIRFEENDKLDDLLSIHTAEQKTDQVRPDLAATQLGLYRGLVDPNIQYEIDQEAVSAVQEPVSYEDVVEAVNKYEGVFLRKTITVEELIDGRTSADIIQELGQEFAEKYPNAAVAEVNVGENFDGDMIVTVRGTIITEEGWIAEPSDEQVASDMRPSSFEKESLAYFASKHGDPDVVREKRSYNPKQTDESVNAASNEEIDDEDEPVFVAPNFWKISDEE